MATGQWVAKAEAALSLEITHILDDDTHSAPKMEQQGSSKAVRYAKIGAATLVGGAVIGATGSLGAPAGMHTRRGDRGAWLTKPLTHPLLLLLAVVTADESRCA